MLARSTTRIPSAVTAAPAVRALRRRVRSRASRTLIRARRSLSFEGERSTIPRSPSTMIGRSGEISSQSPATPATAGRPKERAMMLACEVGPPRQSAIARTRLGSSRAVSAGDSSSATRIEPLGRSFCWRGYPPERCREISRATSRMSSARSRIASDGEASSRAASSPETAASAHSALTRSRRIRSTTGDSSDSSEAIMPCASRIAASSEPMSPLDCFDCAKKSSVAACAAFRKRFSSASIWSGCMARRKAGVPPKRTTTARPTAMPGLTGIPCSMGLLLFVETAGDQVFDGGEGVGFVLPADGEGDVGPLRGGEQKDTEDALAVHLLAVLADLDGRLEPARRLDELRRRPGVEAEPVADRQLPLDHRPADSGVVSGGASSLASRSEATQIERWPRSLASRAISATGFPLSWRVAHLSTIGRLTPVTISTRSFLRNESVRFVGVPPNMSVRMIAPSPLSACARPAAIRSRASSPISLQSRATATIEEMLGWMVRAAAFSSSARRPCVTSRIPIIGRRDSKACGPSFPGRVPVGDANRMAALLEHRGDPLGHVDGAVTAPGAADPQRQVALLLALVEREQVVQELSQPRQEPAGLRVLLDVGRDRGVRAGLGLQLRDEVRVGQEAHVEEEVHVVRNAEFVTEGGGRDDHPRARGVPDERLLDEGTQLVDGHLARVHDDVGDRAHFLEHRALAPQRLQERPVSRQRVRAPRLGKAADQSLLRSVEEEQPRARDPLAQPREDLGEACGEVGVAHVEDDADPRGGNAGEQGLDQLQREVVYAEVAHVLEALVDVALAGPREPGGDDEALRKGTRWRRGGFAAHYPRRAGDWAFLAICSSTLRANSLAAS